MQETWIPSLGGEDPLEKGKAVHTSILAWRIPWTVLSMGLQRVRHDWVTFTFYNHTARYTYEILSPRKLAFFKETYFLEPTPSHPPTHRGKKKKHVHVKRWSLPVLNSEASLKRVQELQHQERGDALRKANHGWSKDTMPDVDTAFRVSREAKAIRHHPCFSLSFRISLRKTADVLVMGHGAGGILSMWK